MPCANAVTRLNRQQLALTVVAGHLDHDVALVLRLEIVAVDDTDRVIELKAVAETQTGARIKLKHPAVLDHDANAGRDEDGFVAGRA